MCLVHWQLKGDILICKFVHNVWTKHMTYSSCSNENKEFMQANVISKRTTRHTAKNWQLLELSRFLRDVL